MKNKKSKEHPITWEDIGVIIVVMMFLGIGWLAAVGANSMFSPKPTHVYDRLNYECPKDNAVSCLEDAIDTYNLEHGNP